MTLSPVPAEPQSRDCHAIKVVDEETGRGVPLVELRTVNAISWWTDSDGVVAFDEPGLMDTQVFLHVRSPGYEYPKDMFGSRGLQLTPTPGGSTTIKLKRLNIAERLYRITGEGIYRDSVIAGLPVPIQHPLLNAQVTGQDTVIVTPYRGKLYWFWGDTDRIGFTLGNFGASGATSEWPGHGGLDPAVGVDLTYFVDESGFSKPMCNVPARGMQWIECLLTIPDKQGVERLVARLATHRGLGRAQGWYLLLFDDEKQVFETIQEWDIHESHDSSHPFRARVDGTEYIYLYPNWRVKPDLESLKDMSTYEALTCVAGDGVIQRGDTAIDRDAAGHPVYTWKAGADRLNPGRMRRLIGSGLLQPGESWIDLHDIETGERVRAGRGSTYWNEFRQRWVLLTQANKAGEIWFAEADTPVGPWVYARRVVTHGDYNFYNPTQHPFFDQEGGRIVYFEGTYTDSFSEARNRTPRYNYNQMMYRLDLADSRLSLPAPVYCLRKADGGDRYAMRETVATQDAWDSIDVVAFYAIPPKHMREGLIPVYALENNGQLLLQTEAPSQSGNATPLFLALPPSPDLLPPLAGPMEGRWNCTAQETAGGDYEFELDLTQKGDEVRTADRESALKGKGTFKDGHLSLSITVPGGELSFRLDADVSRDRLTGIWQQEDGTTSGTWTAERVIHPSNIDASPAVAGLYEYLSDGGKRVYSTDPEAGDRYGERAPEPLCRAWTNPATVVVLDTKAQPIPIQTGPSPGTAQ